MVHAAYMCNYVLVVTVSAIYLDGSEHLHHYLISLSDELSLVSHSLCGFFTWLAYALDHMYRIGLRNSV